MKQIPALVTVIGLGFGTLWAVPQAGEREFVTLSYESQPGDSALGLAQFYGLPASHLAATNEFSDAGLIPAEARLQIPVTLDLPGTILHEAQSYTIQPGDTLYEISDRYGLDLLGIVLRNSIEDINTLEAGQELMLPTPFEAKALMTGQEPIPDAAPPSVFDGKQVLVDLSQQRVYAYENGTLLRVFIASTGLPRTPTVQGDYAIERQLERRHMTGPGYDLPDVPFVSYFYDGYAFHGTYWHSNFGTPMSHGCVNMRTEDAQWLYEWVEVGTAVRVIP